MKISIFNSLQQLLRQRDEVFSRALHGELKRDEFTSLFMLSLVFFMGYGLLIGANYGWPQAITSAVKLPILFFLTAAICFPTLFFFMSYLGIKQNLKQMLNLVLISLTVISTVLAVFAPITFFFLITTGGYEFYKFLNIVIFAIAGIIGVRLFHSKMLELIAAISPVPENTEIGPDNYKAHAVRSKARWFLLFWSVLFAIIGAQLSYTLSPFFGDPGKDFLLINKGNDNFFKDVIETLIQLNKR